MNLQSRSQQRRRWSSFIDHSHAMKRILVWLSFSNYENENLEKRERVVPEESFAGVVLGGTSVEAR